MAGGFLSQRASNAVNVSIWWRHKGRLKNGAQFVAVIKLSSCWGSLSKTSQWRLPLIAGLSCHDDVIKWKHFPPYWALCEGNPPVIGEFPSQRPVTRSFDVFFHLRLNQRLCKQSRRRWFDTPSHSLWRHCYVFRYYWPFVSGTTCYLPSLTKAGQCNVIRSFDASLAVD